MAYVDPLTFTTTCLAEVAVAEDQQQVETLAAKGPHEALAGPHLPAVIELCSMLGFACLAASPDAPRHGERSNLV